MQILHEPVVTLGFVRIRAVSLMSLELDVVIRVENPNPVGVTLREIPFLVLIRDGERRLEIANGNTGNTRIRAQDNTEITVPITSRNTAILRALATFITDGGIELTIKGNAVVDAVITCWTVPFEKTIMVTIERVAGAVTGPKS